MISRIYRIGTEGQDSAGKVQIALAEIGIAVRDASGEFRDFDSIIRDLSEVWSSLNNVTQQNIAQTIAGTYHYSRFLAMMENMDIATDATSKALNSQNSALDENEKHLTSITGRLGTLASTVQEKFSEAISADWIKSIVSGVTVLIDYLGSLRNIILLLATAMIVWKGTQITTWLISSITALSTYNVAIGRTTIITQAAATQTWNLTLAVKTLWATIRANPLGLLITAITTVILYMDYLERKQEKIIQQQSTVLDSLKTEQQVIARASKYYEENYDKINSNDEIKQQLLATQEELVETFGIEASGIDLINGKYETQLKLLQGVEKQKLKAAKARLEYMPDVTEEKFADPFLQQRGIGQKVTGMDKSLREKTFYVDEYIKKIEDMRDAIVESGEEEIFVNGALLRTSEQKNSALQVLQDELDKQNDKIDLNNKKIQTNIDLITIEVRENYILADAAQKVYNALSKKISTNNLTEYETELTSLLDGLSSSKFKSIDENFQNIDNALSIGTISMSEYKEEADSIRDSLKELGFNESQIETMYTFQDGIDRTIQTAEELEQALTDSNKAYEDSKSRVDTLNGALQELYDSQKLSAGSVEQLLLLYPELQGQLTDTEGSIKKLIDIREDEKASVKSTFKAYISESDEFYDKFLDNNADMFEGLKSEYVKDLKNFANIQQLKMDLQKRITMQETDENLQNLIKMANDKTSDMSVNMRFTILGIEEELNKMKLTSVQIEEILNKVADELTFDDAADELDRLNDKFDELLGNLHELAGAIEELDENERLNAETLIKLIAKYPELANAVGDNVALMQELKRLHGEEANAMKDATKAKMLNDENFIKQLITNNEGYWNGLKSAYHTDLKNWSQYMRAKAEMSNKVAALIGEQWDVDMEDSLTKVKGLENWAAGLYGDAAVGEISKAGDFLIGEIDLEKKLDSYLDGVLNNIDWDSIGFSDDFLGLNEKDQKELSKVLADRYTELKLAIEALNNALTKNQQLQALSNSDKERLDLLDQEIRLIDKKKLATEALIKALEQEKIQKVAQLTTYGVKFDKSGKLETSNISSVLTSAEAEVNRLAETQDEKAYERAKKRFELLTSLKDRIEELEGSELPSAYADIFEGQVRKKAIGEEKIDIGLENFQDTAEALQKSLKPATDEIERLQNELSLIDNDDYTARMAKVVEINDAIAVKTAKVAEIIQKLKDIQTNYPEVQEAVNEVLEEYGDIQKENIQLTKENIKSIEDMTESQKEAAQKSVNDAVTAYVEWYNGTLEDQIEILENLSDAESDLADQRLKDNKKQIDDLNDELAILKAQDDQIKETQERTKHENDIAKQENLVENLKKEKTQRVYVSGEGFVQMVDTKKIAEEEDKLSELRESFGDWKREQDIEDKEDKIKALEEENKIIEDAFQDQIKLLKDGLIEMSDIIKDDDLVIESWEGLMAELSKYDKTFWGESIQNLNGYFVKMQETINKANLDWSAITDNIDKLEFPKQKTEEELLQEQTISESGKTKQGEIVGMSEQAREQYKKVMYRNSQSWLETNDTLQRERLAAENERIGATLGLVKKDGTWFEKDGIKAFKAGGLVDYTGLAWLDGTKSNPERVLSSSQTKMFDDLINKMPNISSKNETETEIYNINIDKVVSDNALEFVNNLKKLTYSKGRRA